MSAPAVESASLSSLEFKPPAVRTLGKTRKVSPQAKARGHRFAVVLDPQDIHAMDPFLMMAEDWMKAPSGYPNHPHRGFETVTVVLEGEVKHSDSTGRSGVLGVGDIQWMTAGRGVIHSEMPHGEEEAHLLQLWLNLPRAHKMATPVYKDLLSSKMPIAELAAGVKARVISGVHRGVAGIAVNFVPVLGLWVTAESKEEFTIDIPSHFNGFLYVIKGEGQFGTEKLSVKSPTVLKLPPVGEWTDPAADAAQSNTNTLASADCDSKSTAPNSAEPSVQGDHDDAETASNASDSNQSRTSSQASQRSRSGVKGKAKKSEAAWDSRWPLSSLSVRGVRNLEFVLFAGQPLKEPIAHQGPFVMNTEQELQQAFRDFQNGKFK